MESLAQYVRSLESRIRGRVFTLDGRLHLVLGADPETGLARLSCRYGDAPEILYMPIAEVLLRLQEECRKHDQSDA